MDNLDSTIEKAIRNHENEVKLLTHTTDYDVYMSVKNVMRNNPDIFWFSHQWEFNEEEHKVYFRYTMDNVRCCNANNQIDSVVRYDVGIDRVRELPSVRQVMYVYKWIALYCRYNVLSAHNQTIYSVFVYRNSVCTGIAKATQYLLQMLEIESRLVFGRMNNSNVDSRHCWLIVKIKGRWYHLDPTFAIAETGGILRKSGVEPITGRDGLYYNYFCTDTAVIRQSRIIEDEETLPPCNNTIDYKNYQDIIVFPSRHKDKGGLGCLLTNSGSTASVYLAHDVEKRHGVQSVAKFFRCDPNHDLLRKELVIMRECAGEPHILRATHAYFDMGLLYIEQATALSELLASHYFKLTVKGFCFLLLDIIAGLKELLRHGIVYRDIHLNNIYLSDTVENGRNIYKLGDFGSCSFLEGEEKFSRLTKQGGIASKWYMAPETWNSGMFDERSAVYSVGMVAYHLLNDLYPPLWQKYGEESHELRVKGVKLPIPCKLGKPDYEHINLTFLKRAICYDLSERYDSLTALETAIKESFRDNKQYLRVVIIKGADSQNKNIGQHEVNFCSTCIDFPYLEVSNGTVDYIACDIKPDGSAKCKKDAMSALSSSNDYPSRINEFACTCGQSFDIREAEVSFFPQHNRNKDEVGEQPLKSAMCSWGIFDWFRGKLNRNRSNNQLSLSSVNSSVFAPSETKRGDYMIVQVFLYKDGEEDFVSYKATEVDPDARRQNYTPLSVKLKVGDRVKAKLTMSGKGIEVNESIHEMIWQGYCTDCQFGVFVPKDYQLSSMIGTVMLTVNDIPCGRMMFKTKIVSQPQKLYAKIESKAFQKIFISYSHKDESTVKYFAKAFQAQGVDYFFDRHYLKAGDVYPLKIKEYINSADLFILCWSKNAAESDYVAFERHQALELAYPQVDMEKATITIHPISIEPHADYPSDMKHVYNFEEM